MRKQINWNWAYWKTGILIEIKIVIERFNLTKQHRSGPARYATPAPRAAKLDRLHIIKTEGSCPVRADPPKHHFSENGSTRSHVATRVLAAHASGSSALQAATRWNAESTIWGNPKVWSAGPQGRLLQGQLMIGKVAGICPSRLKRFEVWWWCWVSEWTPGWRGNLA